MLLLYMFTSFLYAGPGNILSTICIGAVVLVVTFCYRGEFLQYGDKIISCCLCCCS